jgi:hypothetical protein
MNKHIKGISIFGAAVALVAAVGGCRSMVSQPTSGAGAVEVSQAPPTPQMREIRTITIDKRRGSITSVPAASAARQIAEIQGTVSDMTLDVLPESWGMIYSQPEWQYVQAGSNATFTVAPAFPIPGLTYSWERRGPGLGLFSLIPGATNNSYTIYAVTTNSPAWFRATILSTNGSWTSLPAQLLVWTTNSPLVVYGSPAPSSGPPSGCPGAYIGYVAYMKSAANGYGWKPDHSGSPPNASHVPADNNSTTTHLETVGDVQYYGCGGHIGANTHVMPEDDYWMFTIYFATSLPSGPYGITLTGFKP